LEFVNLILSFECYLKNKLQYKMLKYHQIALTKNRHREERSDVAIQGPVPLDRFACGSR